MQQQGLQVQHRHKQQVGWSRLQAIQEWASLSGHATGMCSLWACYSSMQLLRSFLGFPAAAGCVAEKQFSMHVVAGRYCGSLTRLLLQLHRRAGGLLGARQACKLGR